MDNSDFQFIIKKIYQLELAQDQFLAKIKDIESRICIYAAQLDKLTNFINDQTYVKSNTLPPTSAASCPEPCDKRNGVDNPIRLELGGQNKQHSIEVAHQLALHHNTEPSPVMQIVSVSPKHISSDPVVLVAKHITHTHNETICVPEDVIIEQTTTRLISQILDDQQDIAEFDPNQEQDSISTLMESTLGDTEIRVPDNTPIKNSTYISDEDMIIHFDERVKDGVCSCKYKASRTKGFSKELGKLRYFRRHVTGSADPVHANFRAKFT